jgi:hypothetical protein
LIGNCPPAKECVGTDERKNLAAELTAQLLQAERIEETLIQASGDSVVRRRDADVRAVLNLA